VKIWEKVFQGKGVQKQAEVAITISNFTLKLDIKDKEVHFVLIKRT
jgi:hypothetical protein